VGPLLAPQLLRFRTGAGPTLPVPSRGAAA